MNDPLRVAQLLDDAANTVDRLGWIQGAMFTSKGVCALGAIRKASVTRDMSCTKSATAQLCQHIGGVFVSDWNDTQGRTKEEVTSAMRETAAKIRMGKIGENPKEYEFEPLTAPSVPEPTPAPAPTPEPAKEPAAPERETVPA